MDKEKKAFSCLMKLASSAATDSRCFISVEDWAHLIRLAHEQNVLHLLGIALMRNPEIKCPEALREQLMIHSRNITEKNLIRRMRIMHLLKELESDGNQVQLIKGYSVADYYAYPESRDAVDTDILIPLEQERRVCEHLQQRGFQIEFRSQVGHHSVCQHPRLGKVELHVQLYDEIIQNAWFFKVNPNEFLIEDPVRVSDGGVSYSTLGHTDHLVFLTLHAIKHFISSGMGLRMMLDIAIYFSRNNETIDVDRYWSIINRLGFSTMVNCMLSVMINTGFFTFEDFPGVQKARTESVMLLIKDLVSGGHMGSKKPDQAHSSYEYSRQMLRKNMSANEYRLYMIKHKLRSAHHNMFPSKDRLAMMYPAINRYKYLYPFLAIYQMLSYPIPKIKKGALKEQIRSDYSDVSEVQKHRIEMLKILDLL